MSLKWPFLLIAGGALVLGSQLMPAGCDWLPRPLRERPDLAAIVYESESWTPPDYVHAARRRVEQAGMQFRIVDQDVVDGDGKVPAEIAESIAASKQRGLPALCVQSGLKLMKCVEVPPTADAIVEAVTK